MKIRDLDEPYRSMALTEQIQQGNEPNEDLDVDCFTNEGGFNWVNSLAGSDFWLDIYNYRPSKITPKIKGKFPKLFPYDDVFFKFGEMETISNIYKLVKDKSENIKKLEQFLESELNKLSLRKKDFGFLSNEDDSRERTLLEVQNYLKKN